MHLYVLQHVSFLEQFLVSHLYKFATTKMVVPSALVLGPGVLNLLCLTRYLITLTYLKLQVVRIGHLPVFSVAYTFADEDRYLYSGAFSLALVF